MSFVCKRWSEREINLFPDVWNLVFSQGPDLPSALLTNQSVKKLPVSRLWEVLGHE
jgi:hypothetical protein